MYLQDPATRPPSVDRGLREEKGREEKGRVPSGPLLPAFGVRCVARIAVMEKTRSPIASSVVNFATVTSQNDERQWR